MVAKRNNKKAIVPAPDSRSDMSHPDTQSHLAMSQGHNGFRTSHPSSESNQNFSIDDVSAYNTNVNPKGTQMSRDVTFSPLSQYDFPTMSPSLLGSIAADGNWPTPTAPGPQLTDISNSLNAQPRAHTPSQTAYLPFPTPSDTHKSSPGPPAAMAASPYAQYLEEFKQALTADQPGQTNSWLPQLESSDASQPQQFSDPSRALPPPYSSSSFNQLQLPDAASVTAYLEEVVWRPSTGMYGVPTTQEQKAYYVKKICLGLVNLSNLWDKPEDVYLYAMKFTDTGTWCDSRDIEATAHIIVSNAMRIHKFGVTGSGFRRSEEFESLNAEDMDFTFPQRIHFLGRLFWHSKVAAHNVMMGRDVARYVALPFTSLRQMGQFEDEWSAMSDVDRLVQMEILPYPQGLKHPSCTEQEQLAAHIRMFPSLVNNYMATGGQSGTFASASQLLMTSGVAASGKRPADRDERSKMEPAAKRYQEGVRSRNGSGFEDPKDGGGRRSSNTMEARSANRTSGSDRGNM